MQIRSVVLPSIAYMTNYVAEIIRQGRDDKKIELLMSFRMQENSDRAARS
jgi:hypothetical protein